MRCISSVLNFLACPYAYFVDKADGHRMMLYKKLEKHIQNYLPLRLLRLEDMTLVHRSEVQNQIRPKIEENNLACEEDVCPCFEELKKDMQFAILSHRWDRDELSFHDLSETIKPAIGASSALLRRTLQQARSEQGTGLLQRLQEAGSNMPANSGFTKLVKLCEIAAIEDCKFVWLDTVCINKESSAELEESIRSMFRWYRDSQACIVHLARTSDRNDMYSDQWFKRGWTLQELLAPRRILFFARDWGRITDRYNDKDVDDITQESPPLIATISKITKIPIEDLIDFKPGLYNIRQRMSWASSRETTRVEDKAYSLLGIFGVTIPVAYGERETAFYRLQVEIMERSGDRGLFHWQGEASAYNSMLAAGPECFPPIEHDAEITHRETISDSTYTLTNLGLCIWLKVYRPTDIEVQRALGALLNPNLVGKSIAILAQTTKKGTYLGVVLKSTGASAAQQYNRMDLIYLDLPPAIIQNREPIEVFIT